MEYAIQLQHVNKHIGKRHILKDVTFDTFCGEVFGFLGPNGAGKTTTIKLLTGLLKMEDGSAKICGLDVEKEYTKAMACVGAIVENPEMYPYLSGMQNLMQFARMRKGITKERIDEVVAMVGLSDRIHDKVKKYSLGMRQRLGVAQALLHKPRLLILDEPTNGLDAAGIHQLRDLLKDLAHKEQICVLVSSHLMSEMELMCDRVGIIIHGHVAMVRTVDELKEMAAEDCSEYRYQVNDSAKAASVLDSVLKERCGAPAADQETGSASRYFVKILSEREFAVSIPRESEEENIAACNQALFQNGVVLYSVTKKEAPHLEEAFLKLTGNGGGQIA